MMTLAEVAAWTGGQAHGTAWLEGVSTDTRRLEPGSLFVALRGRRFDGHRFLSEAQQAGAAAALVEHPNRTAGLPRITVRDTGRALQDLAAKWRAHQPARVVAITGSCGKTTVKDMTAEALRMASREAVLATPGNWNNTVGTPLTLLGLRGCHTYGVVEVGINRTGEMDRLAEIVRPDVAVITNAAPAHLAGLGSVAAVAAEKGRLLTGMSRDGVAVINADSPFADHWAAVAPGIVFRYGLESPGEVVGRWEPAGEGGMLEICTAEEKTEAHLGLPGQHNARNALAAAAVAVVLGFPLEVATQGLARTVAPEGRLQVRETPPGWIVLDDTYNANPASLEAALPVLTQGAGRKWLVLGNMGELGPEGWKWHGHVGARARAAGVSRLLAVGELATAAVEAFGPGAWRLTNWWEAAELLEREAVAGDRILVKGSRSMRLERLVRHLTRKEG